MSTIRSINPATGMLIKEYTAISNDQLQEKITIAETAFTSWKTSSFEIRKKLLTAVGALLRNNKDEYATLITTEMGKRIAESTAEVEKCAWVCEYFAEHAEALLKEEVIATEAKKSFVRFEPLGIIFAIMPWNFPFWQVFRCAALAIMAGNTVLLKHASNVPACALIIEKIFTDAGAPTGVFQTLLISSTDTELVIADPRVRMVSLTGSEDAGSQVGALAGKHIKKSVLELGGSDPFIVLADADVVKAVTVAATARMNVSGQSCIAAKRFIVHKDIAKQFTEEFKKILESKKIGDPMDPMTDVAPLVSEQILTTLDDQVQRSVKAGATVALGGKRADREGFYYLPTILADVKTDMAVAVEETFGPVAAIISVSSDEEAIEIANDSHFGLGASLWTSDPKNAEIIVTQLDAGAVFVNAMVKSDPRLPFGGTKFSGYGRELSSYGLKEFVNIKSVWIET